MPVSGLLTVACGRRDLIELGTQGTSRTTDGEQQDAVSPRHETLGGVHHPPSLQTRPRRLGVASRSLPLSVMCTRSRRTKAGTTVGMAASITRKFPISRISACQ